MRPVNSGVLGAAIGSLFLLPIPAQIASGKKLARLRIKAVVPVTSTDASNYTFSNADAVSLFAAVFSAVTIAFGDKVLDTVDDALPFARMREMLIAASEVDMIFNGGQLNTTSTTSSNKFVATASATTNLTIEFVRTFVFTRGGSNLHAWCPGSSQVRQLRLQVVMGSLASIDSGKQTVGSAGSSLTVFFDDMPAATDNWVKAFRLYRNTTGGLTQEVPAGGGGLLALWEWTNPGASTTLTIFNVQRDGDTPLHEDINAADVVRDQQNVLPLGAYDMNQLVTLLFVPDATIALSEIPTASRWIFNQPNNDLTPPQTAWLYVPTVEQSYVDGIVGPNATGGQGKPPAVKAITSFAAVGKVVPPHIAAIAPIALVTPDSPAYQLNAGRLFQNGQAHVTHIPDATASAAKQSLVSAGASGDALLSKLSAAIARSIPGSTTPLRGGVTPAMQMVGAHIASFGAATQAGKNNLASKGASAVTQFRSRLF